jgi:hypothetical protein
MKASSNRPLWVQMVMESSPIITEPAAELLYHRAASAWGSDQLLQVADGTGGWVDLTKLFEQYRILQVLKGE